MRMKRKLPNWKANGNEENLDSSVKSFANINLFRKFMQKSAKIFIHLNGIKKDFVNEKCCYKVKCSAIIANVYSVFPLFGCNWTALTAWIAKKEKFQACSKYC